MAHLSTHATHTYGAMTLCQALGGCAQEKHLGSLHSGVGVLGETDNKQKGKRYSVVISVMQRITTEECSEAPGDVFRLCGA